MHITTFVCDTAYAKSVTDSVCKLQKPKYTFSRNTKHKDDEGNTGSGWSREGMKEFNRLFDLVLADRKVNTNRFIEELCRLRDNRAENKTETFSKKADYKPRVIVRNCFEYINGIMDDTENLEEVAQNITEL